MLGFSIILIFIRKLFLGKKFIIKESQLVRFIFEDVNLSGYDSEDFIEVFFLFFRPWVQKKHGDEIGKLPFSFLVKKYIKEFAEELGVETRFRQYGSQMTTLIDIGKEIVRKGKHQLPTMRESSKFTERFKKHLDTIIEMLDLPNFMQIVLKEEKPYEVKFQLRVEYPALMNSDYKRTSPSNIYYNFREYLETYMGIEIGRVTHGELEIEDIGPEILNFDEWQKLQFNKMKSDIKKVGIVKGGLHSIRMKLDPSSLITQISLIYRERTGYQVRNEIRTKAREILDSSGQNKNYVKLEG